MDLGYFEQMLGPAWPAVWTLVKIVAILIPLLTCVAYLTLWERKVIGWMQVRRGPNRVTVFGVRWLGERVVTSLKLTNLGNEQVQQHIFGDIVKRQVAGEVRVAF